MKPTLKEIEDNYERVLLQLENGRLAGIKRLNCENYYVVEQQDWNSHCVTIELSQGYNRESNHAYNIDRITFLDTRNALIDFMDYGIETDITHWDWDINNPQCDDQMDTCEYWLSSRSMDKSQKLEIFKKAFFEGDNKTVNNILDIYGYRRRKKIDKKYEQLMELTKLADERYTIFKDCSDKLDKLYKEDGVITHALVEPRLAETTKKHLEELAELREEECCDLENLISEVHAQLSMCETYEQKQNVLNNYKILKSNGKINA